MILLEKFDNLAFSVTGVPVPEVQLFANDELVVDESDKLKLVKNGEDFQILFKQKDPSNTGTYKVHAKNIVGEAESRSQLTIQGGKCKKAIEGKNHVKIIYQRL